MPLSWNRSNTVFSAFYSFDEEDDSGSNGLASSSGSDNAESENSASNKSESENSESNSSESNYSESENLDSDSSDSDNSDSDNSELDNSDSDNLALKSADSSDSTNLKEIFSQNVDPEGQPLQDPQKVTPESSSLSYDADTSTLSLDILNTM